MISYAEYEPVKMKALPQSVIRILWEVVMDRTKDTVFRRGDWVAIVAVLVLAVGLWVLCMPRTQTGQDAVVQIYLEGSLVQELPLFSTQEVKIQGEYLNTISIEDGRVCISRSECPGEDCVHSGYISQPGRSLVCLPNRVEVRISGSGDVDFVVG